MIKYNNSIVIQFDTAATGNAGSGKPVTVLIANTEEKAPLFDEAGNQINNPIFADSQGNYGFFIADGVYDIYIDMGLPSETVIYDETIKNPVTEGGSGVTSNVEEVPLTAGQTDVLLTEVDANLCAFYVSGSNADRGRLNSDEITIFSAGFVRLTNSQPSGTTLIAVENDVSNPDPERLKKYPSVVTAGQTEIFIPEQFFRTAIVLIDGVPQFETDGAYQVIINEQKIVMSEPFDGTETVELWVGNFDVTLPPPDEPLPNIAYRQFDLLTEAVQNTDLVSGQSFTTNGYHTSGLGGGFYKVVELGGNTSTALDYVPLASGFFAKFIPKTDGVLLSQAGALFTDEGASGADDLALQTVIEYCINNGFTVIIDGKESHLYDSHPLITPETATADQISIVIRGASGANTSMLRNHGDTAVTLDFDTGQDYKGVVLKDFILQSNGLQNDTAVKIKRWFESCTMQNVFAVGHRYAFHILNSFNPSFYNCYARQAANRHAPDGNNDTTPSYGWWIDGTDGPINALYFYGCSAERFWHNRYVDNTADVGNFVSLEWNGGVIQTAWNSGTMMRGGGMQCTYFGGYNENNWEQAQRLNDGSGVLANEGVNFTVQGITGFDNFSVAMYANYQQISANIQNNAPVGLVTSLWAGEECEQLNLTVDSCRHAYNDPAVVDWDYYVDDTVTQLRPDIKTLNTSKISTESVYIGDRWIENNLFTFQAFPTDTGEFPSQLFSFTPDSAPVFIKLTYTAAATWTTPPVWQVKDALDATVGTINAPTTVAANEQQEIQINLNPKESYRLSQSTTGVGGGITAHIQIYNRFSGWNNAVSYII